MLLVPETAREGNSNNYTLRVEHTSQYFTINTTQIVVSDNLDVDLRTVESGEVIAQISENFTFVNLIVANTGNADLELNHTGIAPDGWTINFANPPAKVDVLKEANVVLAILPPNQTDAGFGFDLPIYVEATTTNAILLGY